MSRPLSRLGDLTVEQFLAEYWQRKPLVVRGALSPADLPLDGEGVLELAARADAESRLIVDRAGPPALYYGPFEPEEFEDLPEEAWTVLVQEVDRLLPLGGALMDRFRFLPNWRMDDLMVSWAMPGGGVGAHIDQYDVFLLQGQGRRRWEFGEAPVDAPEWRDDSEVAILREFVPEHTAELAPGDLLYLPPRVAHNGVALEPCITLSVGFRAPSRADLLTGIGTMAAEAFSDADRFTDPGRAPVAAPGLLDSGSLTQLRNMVREALADDARLDRWLGRIVTESPRGESLAFPEEEVSAESLKDALEAGAVLRQACASRFAWTRPAGGVLLFVAGRVQEWGDREEAARAITGTDALDYGTLGPHLGDAVVADTLVELVNDGLLLLE